MRDDAPGAPAEADGARRFEIVERPEIPADGLVLGYGAMLPLVAAALIAWLGPPSLALPLPSLAAVYGAAILLFLSGVRRGLSFRTPGGPRPRQIGFMLWLFAAGGAALVLPPAPSFAVLTAGFGSLLALDPAAARRAEAPLYFARLRPPQMALATAACLALLVRVLVA